MKKLVLTVVAAAALASMSLTATASENEVKMAIGGKPMTFANGEPFIEEGSSFFPVRDLLISLGVPNDDAHIIWNGDEQTVTAVAKDVKLVLKVGDKSVYRNGVLFRQLEVPVQNVDGHVYLPARAVAEAFGYKVGFDADTSTVQLSAPSPDSANSQTTGDSADKPTISFDDAFRAVYDQMLDRSAETDEQAAALLSTFYNETLGKLAGLYDRDHPDSTDSRKVAAFVKLYIPDAKVLAQYSVDKLADMQTAYNFNAILYREYSAASAAQGIGIVVQRHPNADARYNAAFLLSELGTDDAYKALTSALMKESTPSVFGNMAAASIKLAKADSVKIEELFNLYVSMDTTQRDTFSMMMRSIFSEHDDYKNAWKAALSAKTDSAAAELQKAAGLLTPTSAAPVNGAK